MGKGHYRNNMDSSFGELGNLAISFLTKHLTNTILNFLPYYLAAVVFWVAG